MSSKYVTGGVVLVVVVLLLIAYNRLNSKQDTVSAWDADIKLKVT